MKTKKVEALQENYKTPDSEYDGTFSKTAQFMAPAIGIKLTNPKVFKYFKNAYLNDVNHEHNYQRPIFLLFSIKDFREKDWRIVYSILIKAKTFITEYDVGVQNNEFLLMMVFEVPENYKNDYIRFKRGNYSNFSEQYKKEFPKYLGDPKDRKKNIHWQIINKDPELKRDIEKKFNLDYGDLDASDVEDIWEIPRVEREHYRYKATV